MTQSTMPHLARREFSENWPVVLIAAMAIGVGTMGIGFYSLGLFVAPLQQEFGWSRAVVSGAATFHQLGIFFSAPLIGRLTDRFGVRGVALTSFALTSLALVLLAQAGPSPHQWYALWLLVSLAGCGTTPALWALTVSRAFDRGRGLALGLMLLGTGVAAMLAPALLGAVFISYGWRNAVLVMAGLTAAIGLPVSLLATARRAPRAPRKTDIRGRFERNRATVTLLIVATLLGAIVAGLIIHLVPMLVDRGMAAADAAWMASTVGLAVLIARVGVGYLFDRFHAPRVAGIFLLSPVISCALLGFGGPVVPAALLLGLAAGAEVDMLAYFTSRYASIENYAATYGVMLGVFCLGASAGPLIFGWSVDATGNYSAVLALSAVLLMAVVAMVLTLGPYRQAAE